MQMQHMFPEVSYPSLDANIIYSSMKFGGWAIPLENTDLLHLA